MPTEPQRGETAFHDLSAFVVHPRVSGLALSADGTRLVAAVHLPDADGTALVPGLWELDPAGERDAVRLTRSEKGESAPQFAPDGSLLFLSARPDTDPGAEHGEDDDEGAALWSLPERGEARRIAEHPGGVAGYALARTSGTLAHVGALLPGAADREAHAARRTARKDAKVQAVLHEAGPTRYWDADLGPGEPHAFLHRDGEAPLDLGGLGTAGEPDVALSPDGTAAALGVFAPGEVPDAHRGTVHVVDAATGKRLHTLAADAYSYGAPAFTADGRAVVASRHQEPTYEAPYDETLVRLDLATGEETDLLPGFDNWPDLFAVSPVPGDDTLWFTADEQGHAPVFRRDADGTVTRLTASGTHTDLRVAPDGRTLYALRNAVDSPPTPVRLDAAAPDQQPAPLRAPGGVGPLPGTLTEVHARGADGHPLRAWLALPEGASDENPAPLLLVPHGGPQGTWNGWTWRWNPWPFTARGYAVLLPDPALSTGYGQAMHERGWGQWGGEPYRDLMAMTDAAEARPDIDATRTGVAGASYGGYMANRIAGRTDRFKAIVSHAGLWNLEAFQGDTDVPWFFQRIFGDPLARRERYLANSPHLDAGRITTPMLVVHGARDYRVPVGQGMALFQDLQRFKVPVKYLYFPDENHWVLKPRNSELWYRTVLAFLDHHVLGEEWRRPELV